MTYGRGFALAFVAFCAACGSNGGGGDVLGPAGESPGSDPQAPLPGFEGPVNNATESPSGSGVEPPPSGTEAPSSSGSATCQRFCNSAIAAGCIEEQPGACLTACSSGEIEAEYGECADEFYGLLICIVESPQFVCMETDIEDAEFPECQDEAVLYSQCADLVEPQPEPEPNPQPGGDCTTDAGCVCGNDICNQCLCLTDQDLTTCSTACQ